MTTAIARTAALARAEALQFRRNKTLVFMAAAFPVFSGIAIFFATKAANGVDFAGALAMEGFLYVALVFVQFYPVLSLATTRRDEGVMKRLRTGEARDGEILSAFAIPGAALTVIFLTVMVTVLPVCGASEPVNVMAIFIAVFLAIAISAGLALLVSAVTKNAEAAQITSLPVLILAVVSMGSVRQSLPTNIGDILGHTPFALVFDLAQYGWSGSAIAELASDNNAAPLSFAGVLVETWPMMIMLLGWAILCVWIGAKFVRWDDRT